MDTTKTPRSALYGLGVMAVLFVAFWFRAAPLALDPVRAANAPEQFDARRAIERLARVLGDQSPHGVDSDALDQVRGRLLTEIRALGYEPVVHDDVACRSSPNGSATRCARVQNILFEAGPKSGPAVVLTAHYDSVEASPGAGDDGVGVAVWLEVAEHFTKAPPPKRVLFLLTDGEEAALLGAQAFADNKSYGYEVGRIINLEARGVRGPAMMFETSHPNARLVGDWARNIQRPVSNSLMTAVYELLPNSTDLTVHLGQGHAGVNMAIADGFNFYHTARDDLSMLDPRSVQHMGDQALGAAQAFLASDGAESGESVYSDILSQTFLELPLAAGLVLLGLCFGAAALLVMKPTREADWKKLDWRAFLLPLALYVAAGALAFGLQELIWLIRPEPEFWNAQPQAFNSLIFLGAMLMAGLGLAYLAPKSSRAALFASAWFWFLAIGVALAFVTPGSAMIFLIPGVWFVIAAAAARFWPKYALVAQGVAAFVMLVVFLPLTQLFDVMMGLAIAPLFGVLAVFMISPALALIGPIRSGRAIVLGVVGAGLVASLVWTMIAPAYSVDRPMALNIVAHYDMDERKAVVAALAAPGSLPPGNGMEALLAELPAEPAAVIPGLAAPVDHREIAFAERPAASYQVVGDSDEGKTRTVALGLSAPGAMMVRLRVPEAARPVSLSYAGGRTMPLARAQNGQFVFDCYGRACDGALLTLTFDTTKPPADGKRPPIAVQGYWRGLPDEARAIAEKRPDWALPIGTGDVMLTTRRLGY